MTIEVVTPFHGCGKKIGNYKCGDFVGEPLSDGHSVYCKSCSQNLKKGNNIQ